MPQRPINSNHRRDSNRFLTGEIPNTKAICHRIANFSKFLDASRPDTWRVQEAGEQYRLGCFNSPKDMFSETGQCSAIHLDA